MKKIIIFVLMHMLSVSALANFVVIVNSSSLANSISMSDLKSVFSANISSFGGSKVQLVMLPGTNPNTVSFLSNIGLSAAEFDRIWLEKALSGQANPPAKRATAADVISAVASTPGGVGIIPKEDESKVTGSVKVIPVN